MSSSNIFLHKRFFLYTILLYSILQIPLVITPPDRAQIIRQCSTASVARNFYEEDSNIFYPRVDTRNEKDGITGMEFPLYSYIVYLGYELFGFSHSLGKWVSFLCGLISLWAFYRIVILLFEKKLANMSLFVFTTNTIFIGWNYKFMPESLSLTLHILSIYLFYTALESGKEDNDEKMDRWVLLFSALSLSLAGLIRPWMAIAGAPILMYAYQRFGFRLIRKWEIYPFLFIVIIPLYYWYEVHVPNLVTLSGNTEFYLGTPIIESVRLMLSGEFYYAKLFGETIPQDMIGYGAVFVSLTGVYALFKGAKIVFDRKILGVIFVAFLYFAFIFLITGNHIFEGHNYKLLGIVPYTSIIVAYSFYIFLNLEGIKQKRWSVAFLLILFIGLLGREGHTFRRDPFPGKLLEAARKIEPIVPIKSRVAVNELGRPVRLYFFHRKGWSLSIEQIMDRAFIEEQMKKGLEYLLIWREGKIGAKGLEEIHHPQQVWEFPDEELIIIKL